MADLKISELNTTTDPDALYVPGYRDADTPKNKRINLGAAMDAKVPSATIAQNTADIAQNTADIAQNTADIAQNTADISANAAEIVNLKSMRETSAGVVSPTWYKIGDLPDIRSGANHDEFQVEFWMGGDVSDEKSSLRAIISNRERLRVKLNRMGSTYIGADIVVYSNLDYTHSIYFYQASAGRANYRINHINSTANVWNKELDAGSTTEPTGILVYSANAQKDINAIQGSSVGAPETSFTQVELDGTAFNTSEAIYRLSNGRLLASSGNSAGQGFIWYSNDGGKKWLKSANDETGLNSIYSFKELSNGIILAGGGTDISDGVLFYSVDYGLNWTRLTVDASIEIVKSIEETASYIYLGIGLAEVAVWRTTDKTTFTGWAKLSMPSSPTSGSSKVNALKYNAINGYLYVCGGEDGAGTGGHLWISADPEVGSPTFTKTTINANITDCYTIENGGDYLVVGTRGASVGGVWRTNDMTGASGWTQVVSGMTAVYSSTIHEDGTVYFGQGFDGTNAVFKSVGDCQPYTFYVFSGVAGIELNISMAVTHDKVLAVSTGYTAGYGDIYIARDNFSSETSADGTMRAQVVQVGQARWIGEQTEIPDSTSEHYPFRCGDICSICGSLYTYSSGLGWTAYQPIDANKNILMPKDSNVGIKVDLEAPTFPWADIIGDLKVRGAGPTDPAWTTYRDNISQYQFETSDVLWFSYHIPHDYLIGSDLYIHIHWSHVTVGTPTGTVTWSFESTYAKGHSGGTFDASKTVTTGAISAEPQYTHVVSEVQLSTSGGSATLLDTDLIEPDGVILMRLELTANSLSGATNPFVHTTDIHYQSTGIGTKQKTPDFYT